MAHPRERKSRLCGILSCLTFLGLSFTFCTLIATPARSRSAGAAAVRTAKCTVDTADGKESDCTLIKANDEWILWMNSSSAPRSIHFDSGDNPFTEKSCWDVVAGARARSGPIALNAGLKTYVAHTSDVPCASNPPSNSNRDTARIIVQ
jgi:hypothetical protein